MLEANNLSCIRDDRVLFSGLSFRVAAGEMVQVEGANGAGKTSLLRILAGLAQPDAGHVSWRQRSIRRERGLYHRELLYIGHQAGIASSLTPLENLAFFQAMGGGKRDEAALWRALERVGLAGYEELPASGLSAGQQRRIALARLWLSPAPLWILDEPLTAIDRQGVAQLMSLFAAHVDARGIVLLTTHQALPASNARIRKMALADRPAEAVPCSV
ncbi:cytochrome c biogenesis heme-transporting ATPase CcmA [Acerihabitans arboris]|uniref:Cytochrome c biogenesis heme-transporting ATPase CcmA n=1 Tax=Acerihabitans arboris TaxID=2691583 RepID=A0A845SR47_9GAMM|nr:cytochrome c biogenesis heme-transporting ATPase CcmA [Acerihabitans arboris]NDL65346.1 cytochrome c biogenesis heme-transporting ATPase CcmA [Acerihabitans arboris]